MVVRSKQKKLENIINKIDAEKMQRSVIVVMIACSNDCTLFMIACVGGGRRQNNRGAAGCSRRGRKEEKEARQPE